jgi:hypothetical protein
MREQIPFNGTDIHSYVYGEKAGKDCKLRYLRCSQQRVLRASVLNILTHYQKPFS